MKRWIASACGAVFSLALVASVPEGFLPDGYADRLCDTPQNLTGPIAVSTGSGTGSYPAVVWNGTDYAVAWEDTRDGNSEIYFARVAADGTPLTPERRITSYSGGSVKPSLAWNGSGYGLAWEEGTLGNAEIYWARLDSDGLVTSGPTNITNQAANQWIPSLIWDGSGYGLAYMDTRNAGQYDIYFKRLSASGATVGAELRVTAAVDNDQAPSLVWTGLEYGVAWHRWVTTNDEIYFARISTAPAVVGGELRVTNATGGSQWPSLVWTGSEYGLAWQDERDANSEVYFARITAAGAKLGAEVRITNDTAWSAYPALAWTGSEYGVAWYDARDGNDEAYFGRISAGGAKVGSDLRVTFTGGATKTYHKSLAFGTVGFGLFSFDDSPARVHFTSLGCHADTTPPSCPNGLTVTTNSGTGVTLGWTQPGADRETEVAYHRIYRDGNPAGVTTGAAFTDSPRPSATPSYTVVAVNARGWEASTCEVVTAPPPDSDCGDPWTEGKRVASSSGQVFNPRIVWDGAAYGIAWADSRMGSPGIYFSRVTPDGTLLVAPARISNLGSFSDNPSLAWTGTEYGVAWVDQRDGNAEIYFARISKEGARIGADTRITSDLDFSLSPDLVWTGTEFDVAWEDGRTAGGDIYFTRISATGVEQGDDLQITNAAGYRREPSLVWTGTEFGLAWDDSRDGNREIYFARLSASGIMQGGEARITWDSATSLSPRLAWRGTEYGIVWRDDRSTTSDIYFARLRADGYQMGADVQITHAAHSQSEPRTCWTGSEFVVAWADWRNVNYDLYGATLDASGGVLEERSYTTGPFYEESPDVAMGDRGLGLVYSVDDQEIRFQSLGCGPRDATPPLCPATPAETARTNASVTLGWGPSVDDESEIGHYTIYRDGLQVGLTVDRSWTDTAFDPAAGYLYGITATNAAGLTSSACASVDTSDIVPPTCPENLLASGVTQTSARLDWLPAQDAKSGLKQYKLYRNDLFLANVVAGTTTYTDTTLASGTTYNFAVRGEDWAGNYSTTCTTASVYIATSPIALFITKNADGRNADLDWNNVGLNEYVVYRSTNAQAASELKRVPSDQTKDDVLQDGVPLWFYYIQQRE